MALEREVRIRKIKKRSIDEILRIKRRREIMVRSIRSGYKPAPKKNYK